MRKLTIMLSAVAFAMSSFAMIAPASAAKAPKKTKMGCVAGKEKWDASVGKCAAAKPVKKAKK